MTDDVHFLRYQDINNGDAKWVTTDLFDTDENDRIVEQWDVIAAYSDEPSVNGHSQVDGPTEIIDEHLTEQNNALVASFVDDVLVNHRAGRIVDDRVMLEARRLLINRDTTVDAVARELSFSEASNFSEFFHRMTGKTPETWRHRHIADPDASR